MSFHFSNFHEFIAIGAAFKIEMIIVNFTAGAPFIKEDLSLSATQFSRLLNLPNLPEPINCQNQEEFVSSRNTAQVQSGEFIVIIRLNLNL